MSPCKAFIVILVLSLSITSANSSCFSDVDDFQRTVFPSYDDAYPEVDDSYSLSETLYNAAVSFWYAEELPDSDGYYTFALFLSMLK